MATRDINRSKVGKAITALEALIDEFDPDNREEMKTRADVLTGLLFESGLIPDSVDEEFLDLDDVLGALGKRSSRVVANAARFYNWLSTYDDLAERLSSLAHKDLQIFGKALLEDLKEAKKQK
jgi:hypothetical protein